MPKIIIGLISTIIGVSIVTYLTMMIPTLIETKKIIYYSAFIALIITYLAYKILWDIRNRTHYYLSFLKADSLNKFKLYDPLTYLVFLLFLGLFGPFRATISLFILTIVLFILAQIILLIWVIKNEDKKKIFTSNNATAFIFLLSGFAALIYQIIWQKELLSAYGVNSETVTIIVAVFMAGLGLGAFSSNLIVRLFKYNYLRAFLFIELLIGIYGIFSLDIINLLAIKFNQPSLTDVILQSLLSVLFPTFLMGATLPILVSYLAQYLSDVGKAVGKLYAFNTFGSAIAAFLTVSLILVLGGKKSAILIAVGFNFLTAWLIYIMSGYLNERKIPLPRKITNQSISFITGIIIAFLVGYIALSQEIVWFRLADFSNGNSANTFGILLSLYLLGIAFGALKAEKIIDMLGSSISFILKNLLICFVIFYFFIPLALQLNFLGQIISSIIPYFTACYTAYLMGAILPLVAQITKSSEQRFNYIYAANIVGAVLGSVITGYYTFEYLGITHNILLISYLILATALFVSLYYNYKYSLFIIIMMILPASAHNIIYKNFLEKLQFFYVSPDLYPFEKIIENRHGIITILQEKEDHVVYGNGVYDGKFNSKFTNHNNGIIRAYAISVLHPKPKDVLVIGLSTGSWVKVLTDYKPIEKIDIIELNQGYLEIIKDYPEQASILTHSKNNFYFDDGALWLKKNNNKYDFIVMNNTLYWRTGLNNLISKEFFQLVKAHLKPNGVAYFNTTGCDDIIYTAAHVFKYATMLGNLVAVSDSPFNLNQEQKEYNLSQFIDESNRSLIDFDDPLVKPLIEILISLPSFDLKEKYLNSTKHHWLITKDNLANEFKYDQHFYNPNR